MSTRSQVAKMTSKFKPLVLYATDFYKLSSLLVKRVFLSKPVGNLTVYKQKTKQLLLDQSRPSASPNLAAVKLLHLDKEFGLLKYYGIQEYARRWMKSRSSSVAQSAQQKVGVGGTSSIKSNDNTNVARVAFMITSEQRQKLSANLGYSKEDIRSFKPIEALLLIENNVPKTLSSGNEDDVQYNFRDKLKELVDANEKLIARQASSSSSTADIETERMTEKPQATVSPEDAEHAHVKADVAMALLSAEKGGDQTMEGLPNTKEEDEPTEDKSINDKEVTSAIAIVDEDDAQKQESDDTYNKTSKESETSSTPATSLSVNVTPNDSTELHMKPDIAAAYISSHLQTEESSVGVSDVNESDEEEEDGPGWYEVVMSSIDEQEEKEEQEDVVVALFATKKEALQCVDIKKKLASGRDKRYSVRRRWNA